MIGKTKPVLTAQEFTEIEEAVRQAEISTSGEIVPVLVRKCSDTKTVVIKILFIWVSILGLFEIFYGYVHLNWWTSLALFLAGSGVCQIIAQVPRMQRLLIPKKMLTENAWARARHEFHEEDIEHTRERTGILIFIALMERTVVVLADQSINAKVLPGTWQAVVDEILAGIRSESLAQGLSAGIRRAGQILNEHFPARADDTNELKNHLRIRDE